jgi:hypothetical protein
MDALKAKSPERQKESFDAARFVEEESHMLEKFREKAGKMVHLTALASFLAVSPVGEAIAQKSLEKKGGVEFRMENQTVNHAFGIRDAHGKEVAVRYLAKNMDRQLAEQGIRFDLRNGTIYCEKEGRLEHDLNEKMRRIAPPNLVDVPAMRLTGVKNGVRTQSIDFSIERITAKNNPHDVKETTIVIDIVNSDTTKESVRITGGMCYRAN